MGLKMSTKVFSVIYIIWKCWKWSSSQCPPKNESNYRWIFPIGAYCSTQNTYVHGKKFSKSHIHIDQDHPQFHKVSASCTQSVALVSTICGKMNLKIWTCINDSDSDKYHEYIIIFVARLLLLIEVVCENFNPLLHWFSCWTWNTQNIEGLCPIRHPQIEN